MTRLATQDDYRWLYENTDYMAEHPERRWATWESEILATLDGCSMVYEIGCGRGAFQEWLSLRMPHLPYIGLDPGTQRCMGPFDRQEGHAIVSFDVLEHLTISEIDFWMTILGGDDARHFHAIANMSDVALVDGEQVELHKIQEPESWWRGFFAGHSDIRHHPWHKPCRFAISFGAME